MTILTIGKRLIPTEHIAMIEAFDPATNPDFKSEKDFKGRIVLLNRDTVLTEMTPDQFAEEHGFQYLAEDTAAINPRIFFWVETFTPSESFQPQKPYQSRLKWRDPDGGDQSRLLITEAATIAAMISGQGTPGAENGPKRAPRRPTRSRRKARDAEATRTR